jgi:hypothetical protein
MATESKLGAEQQNTIGKGTKAGSTRAKEREKTRASESTRERKREKQRESNRASQRAREGRKNPQPVPVPASLYPRTVVVRGQGTHHGDEWKTVWTEKQRKKHEDLNFVSRAVWLIRGWIKVGVMWINIIFSLLVSGGGSPRPLWQHSNCKQSPLCQQTHTYKKKPSIFYHPFLSIDLNLGRPWNCEYG